MWLMPVGKQHSRWKAGTTVAQKEVFHHLSDPSSISSLVPCIYRSLSEGLKLRVAHCLSKGRQGHEEKLKVHRGLSCRGSSGYNEGRGSV